MEEAREHSAVNLDNIDRFKFQAMNEKVKQFELVEQFRRDVERLLESIGVASLDELASEHIPDEVSDELIQMFSRMAFYPWDEMLFKKVILSGNAMQPHSELLFWFQNVYAPNIEKIQRLHTEFLMRHRPDAAQNLFANAFQYMTNSLTREQIEEMLGKKLTLDQDGNLKLTQEDAEILLIAAVEQDKSKSSIKYTFTEAISLLVKDREFDGDNWLEGYRGRITSTDYCDAEKIANSAIFCPDEWMKNILDIGLILSPREKKNFPTHIRFRIDEMHQSFTFGNWMSVNALGRSLLEYMIIDRRSALGIEVYEKDQDRKDRPKKISRLVDLASATELGKSIEDDMRRIVEYGNNVMHPEKTRKVRALPARRHDALDCMRRTVAIIQTLYRIKDSGNVSENWDCQPTQ